MIEALVSVVAVGLLVVVYVKIVYGEVERSEDYTVPYNIKLYRGGDVPKVSGKYIEVDMHAHAQVPIRTHMVDGQLDPLPSVSRPGRFWRRIGPYQEEFDSRLLED